MKTIITAHFRTLSLLAAMLLGVPTIAGAATAEQAERLKGELTPFGAERAGNADGSIPAWDGGYQNQDEGLGADGRRIDPFAADKPLFSITGANMAEYADKLSDGMKAMLQKYPDFRMDVYPTRRTAAAPQWVYDNTFTNATVAKLAEGGAGAQPELAYGGIPFPIPENGIEAVWNHELRWRPAALNIDRFHGYTLTSDGQKVMVLESSNEEQAPYYEQNERADFDSEYWLVRSINSGPPIRAGEGIIGRLNLDESKTGTWVYLTGQRRVRKLPNSCCDTPTPFSAGNVSFDEVNVFSSRKDRFDWKLVGKQEMYIPYNGNRILTPASDDEVLGDHYLNPDYVRWELHRVWVVEATLKEGERHTSPRTRYYLDEDTWRAALADRWDSSGALWRVPFMVPITLPEVPASVGLVWGVYDLTSGTAFINRLMNESPSQIRVVEKHKDGIFTPAGLIGASLR
ncbi:hypothetical protein GCM10011352_03840 [Marinobacterium zhoushanense]|uniref:DUF1329 domain-containing protein n=1 Tax=Marinobacterium zhoushanense TaxID=1679163 RepID=A0ABQ1JXI0_9GAMM|nr:DUF1329 domain-containing protein [Marinobacterium zhoushanense]GGB81341.1 hypothetical protein GCM10011352_03840 [Marinobacterium zhoushanense]